MASARLLVFLIVISLNSDKMCISISPLSSMEGSSTAGFVVKSCLCFPLHSAGYPRHSSPHRTLYCSVFVSYVHVQECGFCPRVQECGFCPRVQECGFCPRVQECEFCPRVQECGFCPRVRMNVHTYIQHTHVC